MLSAVVLPALDGKDVPRRRGRASGRVLRASLLLPCLSGLISCGRSEPSDVAESPPALQRDTSAAVQGDSVAAEPAPAPPSTIAGPAPAPPPPVAEPALDSAQTRVGVAPSERAPESAYHACKDSVASRLERPETAVWAKAPDNAERTEARGGYALVGQVRADSLSPGISFLCVVEPRGEEWRVTQLQMDAPPGADATPAELPPGTE
ncbi:MAG: hypothetical protein ABR599_12545 [Gemmatimonadota bacterium]